MAKSIAVFALLFFVLYQISLSSQTPRRIRQVAFPSTDEERFGGETPPWARPQNQRPTPRPNRPTQSQQRPTTTRTTVRPGNQPEATTSNIVCEQNCLKTPEYNPVCGSNMVTYTNMGRLECARRCGLPNLTFLRQGNCPRPAAPEEPTAETTTLSPNPGLPGTVDDACIQGCNITPEYNPVCGTNMITYVNIGRLTCSRRCGLQNLAVLYYGNCRN